MPCHPSQYDFKVSLIYLITEEVPHLINNTYNSFVCLGEKHFNMFGNIEKKKEKKEEEVNYSQSTENSTIFSKTSSPILWSVSSLSLYLSTLCKASRSLWCVSFQAFTFLFCCCEIWICVRYFVGSNLWCSAFRGQSCSLYFFCFYIPWLFFISFCFLCIFFCFGLDLECQRSCDYKKSDGICTKKETRGLNYKKCY